MGASQDRIQTLFLDQPAERRVLGYADSPTTLPRQSTSRHHQPPTAFRNHSIDSTVSSISRYSSSDSHCRKSSVSSNASSLGSPSLPPWHTPEDHVVGNQEVDYTHRDHGYELPCEFASLDLCSVPPFHPSQWEAWISHTVSHFVNCLPPPKTMCIFCDDDDACFKTRGNTLVLWRERMIHIGNHIQRPSPNQVLRPDFDVIEHLYKNNIINKEEYKHHTTYTERPGCDGLLPLGSKLPGIRETQEGEVHNLGKERRELRKLEKTRGKSRAQGKGKETRNSLNNSRKSM